MKLARSAGENCAYLVPNNRKEENAVDAQLRKETVTMEQVTAHGASQAVVEGEITLPGGLRRKRTSCTRAGWRWWTAPKVGLTARRSPAR